MGTFANCVDGDEMPQINFTKFLYLFQVRLSYNVSYHLVKGATTSK